MFNAFMFHLLPMCFRFLLIALFFRQPFRVKKQLNPIVPQSLLLLTFYSVTSYLFNSLSIFSYFVKAVAMYWYLPLDVWIEFFFLAFYIWLNARKQFKKIQMLFWESILLLTLFSCNALTQVGSLAWSILLYRILPPQYWKIVAFVNITWIIELFFLSFILFFLRKEISPLLSREDDGQEKGLSSLIGISFISNIIVVYSIHSLHIQGGNNLSYKILLFVFAGILVIDVLVLKLYKNQEESHREHIQLAHANQAFSDQLHQIQLIEKTQENFSKIKHDLNNELTTLLGLFHEEKFIEAQEFLENKLEIIKKSNKIYTSNPTLNFLLNQKCEQAEKNGLHLKLQILLPENLSLDVDILAVVIGNLLDNALSAVLRSQTQEKEVKCTLHTLNHNLWIKVENPFDTKELFTRKNRQVKGFGLKNIQQVVEKRNGLYKQWIEGETYHTEILFFDILNR